MSELGNRCCSFKSLFILCSLLSACQKEDTQREFVTFNKHILDDTVEDRYGVDIADVDGDGSAADCGAVEGVVESRLQQFSNWQLQSFRSGDE